MAPDLSDQERALLSRCPLFLGVEDALLRSLPALPGVTVEPFAAGEVLYGPGQFRQSLGVILSGQVQVTNGSLSVSLLRAGELFGAAALYNDAPEFAAVLTAQSPCRVLFLPQETLDRLLGEEPLLRRNYLQYLTGRIRFLSGRLRSVAQTGAEGKLARYRSGQAPGHQPRLPVPGLPGPGGRAAHPPGGQVHVRSGPGGAGGRAVRPRTARKHNIGKEDSNETEQATVSAPVRRPDGVRPGRMRRWEGLLLRLRKRLRLPVRLC